MEFYIFVNLNF
jgi:acyl-coenzyme A synthetase/AMP-(fatty) acid ligase